MVRKVGSTSLVGITTSGRESQGKNRVQPEHVAESTGDEVRAWSFFQARRSDLIPMIIFLLSRLGFALLAHAAPSLLPSIRTNPSVLPRNDPLASAWSWFSPWFRFDAKWYVDVAAHGYHWGPVSQTNTNFFPLYPLLIKIVQPLTLGSYWIAALLVANLSFLAALLLLWRWAFRKWGSSVALRVVLFVAVFPFSFFFATPYAEPVFLALAVGAFLCAEQDKWALSAALAGLSAVTRPVGLAVIAGLAVWALAQGRPQRVLGMSLAVLPFLLFLAYLGFALGHPTGFAVYHTDGWVAPRGGLMRTIEIQFSTRLTPFDRIDAFVSILFVVSAVFVWRKIGPSYAVYVLLGVALPLSRSLAGMERYVSVLFPVMAVWALPERRTLQMAVFAISLFLLVVATSMFATGYALF
jgi:hypothetical protein